MKQVDVYHYQHQTFLNRAIADAVNMMCHFYALNILPLGDVMMIAAVRVTFPRYHRGVWVQPATNQTYPGDHREPLLLHLLERALWSLRDPQHLHCNPCHVMRAPNDAPRCWVGSSW